LPICKLHRRSPLPLKNHFRNRPPSNQMQILPPSRTRALQMPINHITPLVRPRTLRTPKPESTQGVPRSLIRNLRYSQFLFGSNQIPCTLVDVIRLRDVYGTVKAAEGGVVFQAGGLREY